MADNFSTGTLPCYLLERHNLLANAEVTLSLDPLADFGLETLYSPEHLLPERFPLSLLRRLPLAEAVLFDTTGTSGYVDLCFRFPEAVSFSAGDLLCLSLGFCNAGTLQVAWHSGTPSGAPDGTVLSGGSPGSDSGWSAFSTSFSGTTPWTAELPSLHPQQSFVLRASPLPSAIRYLWVRLGTPRLHGAQMVLGHIALGVAQPFMQSIPASPPQFKSPAARQSMRLQYPDEHSATYKNKTQLTEYGQVWSYQQTMLQEFRASFRDANLATQMVLQRLHHETRGSHLPFLFIEDLRNEFVTRARSLWCRFSDELRTVRHFYDPTNDEALLDIDFQLRAEPLPRIRQ